MAIPTCLAAALIGLPAATFVALWTTVLVLLLPKQVAGSMEWAATSVALAAIWGMLGMMVAVYHPVYQFARWSWEYYQRAQGSLMETRDRKAQLEQALDDLAHANRQLALTNERITALRLIAEDARKAKAQFVTRVSHEFRAPLNIIIGLVGLMVEKPETYAEELPPDLWKDLVAARHKEGRRSIGRAAAAPSMTRRSLARAFPACLE
jgi:signal transduction histidine kinase